MSVLLFIAGLAFALPLGHLVVKWFLDIVRGMSGVSADRPGAGVPNWIVGLFERTFAARHCGDGKACRTHPARRSPRRSCFVGRRCDCLSAHHRAAGSIDAVCLTPLSNQLPPIFLSRQPTSDRVQFLLGEGRAATLARYFDETWLGSLRLSRVQGLYGHSFPQVYT
jgi:hypothetical protein